jgi:hypothetical protein
MFFKYYSKQMCDKASPKNAAGRLGVFDPGTPVSFFLLPQAY